MRRDAALIVQHPSAPVRYDPPVPEPGTFFTTFQRQFNASEHSKFLAQQLHHKHKLYEGDLKGAELQPVGDLLIYYMRHAAMAVRECSETERTCANDRAVVYGMQQFGELEQQLRGWDVTPEKRRQLITEFISRVLSVRRFALMHGTEVLSEPELQQIERNVERNEDEE